MALEVYQNATMFYDLMFLCCAVLAITFLTAIVVSARHRLRELFPAIAVFLSACFLAVPLSRPLWDRISVLQEVQFPWRWVAVVSVVAPVFAAAGVGPVLSWFRSSKRPLAIIVGGVTLAIITFSIMQIVRPAPILPSENVASRMSEIRQKEGATFWWTEWTRKEAFKVTDRVLAGDRDVSVASWTGLAKDFAVAPGSGTDARIAVFYYPRWQAMVNGQAVATHAGADGALMVPIPEGPAQVRLEFRETNLTMFARYTSVFTAVLLFAVGLAVLVRWWLRSSTTAGEIYSELSHSTS